MSIDWSKAPEGATHWEPNGKLFREGWMKKTEDGWLCWSDPCRKWINLLIACNVSAEREATFKARPQETWDGQGLPPVGTVCEYRHMTWTDYRRCEIRYINDGSLVVYDDGQERFYRTLDTLFRPIRTPEQQGKTEEREKAISEMLGAFNDFPWPSTLKRFCEVLYDAGYRKHVE